MVNQSNRGGMKKGTGKGEQKQHQGVRPGSTTQNKSQRQKNADRTPGKDKVSRSTYKKT